MCEHCFSKGLYTFPTWQNFEIFKQLLLSKQLFEADRPSNEEGEHKHYYECRSCQEVWVLSEPENSWRGYFLPEESASIYSEKLGRQDKTKRTGCLLLLGLVVVFLFLKWFT